tara:strand:- start:1152 stop:2132 length:981 start_codon:yes stop_codon:yes gene_type:complete
LGVIVIAMPDFGDYKNNPLYIDITQLDHLSPQPGFSYQWNVESGRWEPDQSNLFLHGISGNIGRSNELLEGISGLLKEQNDTTSSDSETHRLLSGISGAIDSIDIDGGNIDANITGGTLNVVELKLRTKTVNQKIDEDFILMEDITDEARFGNLSGTCYGTDRSLMDDIYGTHFNNARINPSILETGHPDFFIHAEYMEPDRCVEAVDVFHTDTAFGMRQENSGASNINSYELEDYNNLYDRGLAESITIVNEAPYPLQFHTADRRFTHSDGLITETEDLIYLDSDMSVNIKNDEAGRLYVKRPHTISGYTVKYFITYKNRGDLEI